MATPPTNSLGRLSNISAQMPVANQRVAQGLEAARTTSLQQGIKQSTSLPSASQIQQVGAQQAAQQGQAQVGQAQQGIAAQEQVSQIAQNEQRREQDAALFARQQALTSKQQALSNQLSSLGEAAKSKILDDNLTFKRDELGRTLFNERQLADWAVNKAENRIALQAYEQQARQLSERRMKMLELSVQKIKQSLAQGFDEDQQELDQAQKKRLLIAKQELEKKIARERARAKNRASLFQAGGSIIGAAAGAAVGGPAGALVGSQLGSGLGSIAAGVF